MNKQTASDFALIEDDDPLLGSVETELNNARVSGKDSPEWQVLLDRPMTFLLPDDLKKDVEQKRWTNATGTLRDWIKGQKVKEGRGAECGLSRHLERKAKGYFPIVFGASAGKERTANAMVTQECMTLDLESGDFYLDAVESVAALGIACLAYTSFNDQAEKSHIERDKVLAWMDKAGREGDPTDDDVREWMTATGKYRPWHVDSVRIATPYIHTPLGVMIEIAHDPLDKFRMVFVLDKPVEIGRIARKVRDGRDLYKRKLLGLAEKLGLVIDESCIDVSRAFYMPSHPPGREGVIDIVRGRALTFEELPEGESSRRNAFEKAGAGAEADGREIAGMSAKAWAAKYAKRLEIARLINLEADGKVREDKGGFLVVECPFDEWHGNAGDPDDTGCHVRDADGDTGFVWACKHNSCSGHDRLDMLHKAVSDGWFDESGLVSDDYLVPLSDEELEDGEVIEESPAKSSLDPAAPLGKTAKQKLASLSARFKLVNYKGKVLVIRNVDRAGMLAGDDVLEFWTKPALRDFYAHEAWPEEVGEGKNKKTVWVNPVDRWWTDEAKRHSRVVFDPSDRPREYDVNLYDKNLLALIPAAGDPSPIQDFIRDVICGGDDKAYKWVTLYFAHMVQRPWERPGTALVLYGNGGVGKGTFGRIARRLVEPYDLLATHPEHLLGRFAGPSLATSLCVVSEEAVFGKSAEAADQLKGMATQRDMRVEAKQVQSVQMDVFFRIIIDSNHNTAVRIEGNNSERRYMVLHVSEAMKGNRDGFRKLYEHIEGPAMCAYAEWLGRWNPADAGLDWTDVRTAPETTARKAMFVESLRASDKAFLQLLEDGEFIWREGQQTFRVVFGDGENRIPARALDEWVRSLAGRYDSDMRPAAAVWKRLFGVELDRPKPARATGERQTLDEGAGDSEYAWQPFAFNTPMYSLPGVPTIRDMIHDRTGREAEN
ncbi:primase-helicase family protein [Tabrizicola sp.]|uniref:primase-helicase family protein n=1 Tax=Tabrizicola sp. TaxID=2005166 RepID=UPI002FDDBAA5